MATIALIAAGIGLTVAGAGAGAYGAGKAGKGSGQSRSVSELGQLPAGLYGDQLKDLADIQFEQNRRQAGLAGELYPYFSGLERQEQYRRVLDMLTLYPGVAKAERTATTAQRGADVGDLEQYGGRYADAFRAASPGYAALDSTIAEAGAGPSPLLYSLNADALNAGPSDLRSELQRQALYDLQLGRELSPAQEREASQSARAAWSDRGLLYSNPAAVEEILMRDRFATEREAARRGFAGQAWQLGATEDANNRGFGINVENLNQADRGNRANTILAAGQAQLNPIFQATIGNRTATHPYGLMGGFQPTSITAPSQIMSGAPQVTGMAQAIAPLYNYGSDIFDSSFNAAEARALSKANAWSAIGGGLMSVGGSMAGAGMRG